MARNDGAELFTLPLDQLPDPLPIPPLSGPFDVRIRPPGSKSLTNRALLLAALAKGESVIRGALTDADDARVMISALESLGVRVTADPAGSTLTVRGCDGNLKGDVSLNLENAGTATRFLAAAACLADGAVVIDGNERMRERPIGELIDFLRALGAEVQELQRAGFPPIRVHGRGMKGGELQIGRTLSSQYISAILMIAPLLPGGITLVFDDEITSEPYIDMTVRLMKQTVGVDIAGSTSARRIQVRPGRFSPFSYAVEPDASSASYFLAAAALIPGSTCAIPGLNPSTSLQGDAKFVELLERMSAEVSIDSDGVVVRSAQEICPLTCDLSPMPDLAMTIAAMMCFASGESELRGLRTLRVKETDRIAAIGVELGRIGVGTRVIVSGTDEGLCIIPPEAARLSLGAAPVRFLTYDDHRMAMSLALIGLRRPNVTVANPGCVAKTYPRFWKDFAALYG